MVTPVAMEPLLGYHPCSIGFRYFMYRIGGRLRNKGASLCGANLGIPLLKYWNSNLRP